METVRETLARMIATLTQSRTVKTSVLATLPSLSPTSQGLSPMTWEQTVTHRSPQGEIHPVLTSNLQPPILLRWEFSDDGKQIYQSVNSRAGLAVGDAVFSSVRYTGVMFVNDTSDNDHIGILFGYKDNKNFYTLTSSKSRSNQVGWTPYLLEYLPHEQEYLDIVGCLIFGILYIAGIFGY